MCGGWYLWYIRGIYFILSLSLYNFFDTFLSSLCLKVSLGLCKCLITWLCSTKLSVALWISFRLESLYIIFKLQCEPAEAGSLRAQSLTPSVPLISMESLNGHVILYQDFLLFGCFTSPHHVCWTPRDAAHTGMCHGCRECACLHGLGAAWDLLGRGCLPTSAGLTLLWHCSPPLLSVEELEGTFSGVSCCQ